MKRAFAAALCAALPALALACGSPAQADLSRNPGDFLPELVSPELFRGFEPIPPDEFGLSPTGRFLVLLTNRHLQVVLAGRRDPAILTLELLGDLDAGGGIVDTTFGFDPSDTVLFVLERVGGTYRLRVVNLPTGTVVYDRNFQIRPEIRTNLDGSVNAIIIRDTTRSTVIVLNGVGLQTLRRSFASLVEVGVNLVRPSIALLSPDSFGRTRIEVYDARRGRPTLRETANGPFEAGFEPFGSAFVVARATSQNTFRVKMVQSTSGRFLVSRSFTGTLNAGFTADSSLLGVETDLGPPRSIYLFSTRTGAQLRTR